MATGLFIVVVLIFILRGIFLGLSGVIGRLLGFVLAYYFAYNYRGHAVNFIEQQAAINLAPMILEVICGVAIFISTLLITGLLVAFAFKLLASIIPAFKQLADSKSSTAMVAGAVVNGSLGAAIVLMVMWGIGLANNKAGDDSALQRVANQFGNKVFAFVTDNTDINIQTSSYSQSTKTYNSTKQTRTTGTAIITSSNNPEKSLSIETFEQMATDTTANQGNDFDLTTLLANEKVQSLLNNPELRNTLMQQLQNNPEKVQQLLDNPQLQELLKNYPAAPVEQ